MVYCIDRNSIMCIFRFLSSSSSSFSALASLFVLHGIRSFERGEGEEEEEEDGMPMLAHYFSSHSNGVCACVYVLVVREGPKRKRAE